MRILDENKAKFARSVKVGPTNDKDRTIFESIQGQMSDGLWENSPKMVPYWKNSRGLDEKGDISVNADNFYQDYKYRNTRHGQEKYPIGKYNPYAGLDDQGIRDLYANRLRTILKNESKYYPGGKFSKGDQTVSRFLSRGKEKEVTYGDAYDLYQRLKKYIG